MGLGLEDISHAFAAQPVLRGITLRVRRGEVACLLGPSGCGKTTLLRVAAGLEELQQGRVTIGERIAADAAAGRHLPPEARRAGLMFQDYALFPHLNVFENIVFGIGAEPRRRQWARAALERLGLDPLASAYPHTLSGGEQQRCALLRALAPEPEVLLLDEPFSGLDVSRRVQVRERTLDILRDSKVATLIVTHDPEEAMFMADRLWVMKDGEIIQEGAPADIYLHPRNPFVAALFGPLNRLQGTVRGGSVRTPLGPIPTPGLGEGALAELLIRPEGLAVNGGNGGAPATVISARLLGRSSQLRLAVAGIDAPLHAQVAGIYLPAPGTPVTARIEPRQAFVFASA